MGVRSSFSNRIHFDCEKDAVLMTNRTQSEHKRNVRLTTWIVVVMFGSLLAVGVIGAGGAFYMSIIGQMTWWEGALLFGLGSAISCGYGFPVFRFIRRVLVAKAVRLLDGGRLEIITARDKSFIASLPEQVKHIVVDEDGLSVTLHVENRQFVVDSSEFTDKDRIKDFLRDALEKANSGNR